MQKMYLYVIQALLWAEMYWPITRYLKRHELLQSGIDMCENPYDPIKQGCVKISRLY